MTSLARYPTAFLSLFAISGCLIGDGDDAACTGGKCDGAGGDVCTDVRYGDGMCDPQLECTAPDIDCFTTFETDEAAATWFADFEVKMAADEGRAARALLPASDPRFAKMRGLLDRGWEAFQLDRPVGKLARARPALVLVEDDSVNAFVAPDIATGNAGFAVMVQTGLVALNGTDDETLGVMMHEFQHAVGLHVVAGVRDRMRRFYIAPAGSEPIGKNQVEDMRARELGVVWRAAAAEAGYFTSVELGGLPLNGELHRIFTTTVERGLVGNPTGCQHGVDLYNALRADLIGTLDPISGALTANLATVASRVQATLAALRDECLAGVDVTFAEVVAGIAGVTPEMIDAQLTPEDRALVADKHIIDAIAALAADRRAKMRAAEAAFESATGRPWSALRYFSTEEDADDVSVPVLRGAGLDPAGNGDFLLTVLQGEANARCKQVLASGEVPHYGFDLDDEHHATCWRVHHVRALADSTAKSAPRVIAPAAGTVAEPARLPIPPRLRDLIMY